MLLSLRPALLLTAATLCVACQSQPQPRPFAGRGGRNLDQPPRYGEPSRYVEPIAPAPGQVVDPNMAAAAAAAGIDPRTLPPGANLTPPANLPSAPGVDPGLTVTPPTPSYPPAPAPTQPPVSTPAPTPPPSDVPFARPVPGKPGYVFSPRDGKKVISVEGLRPGSKAKDPDTGEIFRVPYQ
ncbi:MAG: hypothetical protein LDL31_02220 [Prosthecobacter sp.]|jgi:hypothetical protein|nr:hypothetical protein [Prosthecobacter sp.]